MADALNASYQAWLAKPGRGGKAHVDHEMRRFRRDYSDLDLPNYGAGWLNQYENAWDCIAAKAPIQAPN